jgi:hypothetical protein
MRDLARHAKRPGGNIEIADFVLSAFAMSFMQSVLFLAFERALEEGLVRSPARRYSGIGRFGAYSDTC